MQEKIEEEGKAFYDSQSQIRNEQNINPKSSNIYSKVSSILIQAQQIRIPEEQILIKDLGQKALVNSIMCPICLLTLPMPYYECEQCNNSFCPECIGDWWNKNPSDSYKQCIFKCQKPTFKKVKRSNTYMALLDALQFKCGACQMVMPLSSYERHKNQECQQITVACLNQNCHQVVKRKDLAEHQKECEFRLEECKYCKLKFVFKDLFEHQQTLCPQKLTSCPNRKCSEMIKHCQLQGHIQKCEFKELECQWCGQQFIQRQHIQHQQHCQSKTYECQWCTKNFSMTEFENHNCPSKRQLCRLCQKPILYSEMNTHKSDCMFQHMVLLKQQNIALAQENMKLNFKLNELQQLIEYTIANSEGKAMQVMRKFKMSEKKQFEQDLLRIDNSMASINRLYEEEMTVHMNKSKFLILGHSLCIQCKLLEKKFTEMKQPLNMKRKEVMMKIKELDNFNQTSRG